MASLLTYHSPSQFALSALGFVCLVTLINLFSIRKIVTSFADFSLLVLPAFFLLGIFGVTSLVSSDFLKLLIAVPACYMFLLYEFYFPKRVRVALEELFSVTTGFAILVFLWGINFFFTPTWWIFMLILGLAFFLLYFQAFYKFGFATGEAFTNSLLGTLVMLETAWAVLYWSVHFLTSAMVTFVVFYVVYMLSAEFFKGTLTRRKIYFQLWVVSFILFFSVASSLWRPV